MAEVEQGFWGDSDGVGSLDVTCSGGRLDLTSAGGEGGRGEAGSLLILAWTINLSSQCWIDVQIRLEKNLLGFSMTFFSKSVDQFS
jgi:hypothetical protein